MFSIDLNDENETFKNFNAINIVEFLLKSTKNTKFLMLELNLMHFQKALHFSFNEEDNNNKMAKDLTVINNNYLENLYQIIKKSNILNTIEKLKISFINGSFDNQTIEKITDHIKKEGLENLIID